MASSWVQSHLWVFHTTARSLHSRTATFLFKVEYAVRNGLTSVTSQLCSWNQTFCKKVHVRTYLTSITVFSQLPCPMTHVIMIIVHSVMLHLLQDHQHPRKHEKFASYVNASLAGMMKNTNKWHLMSWLLHVWLFLKMALRWHIEVSVAVSSA